MWRHSRGGIMCGIQNISLMWFFIGLFLILAELAAPGFIIIFFGIGAWVTTLFIELGLAPTFNSQLIVFLLASIASLLIFRKKGQQVFAGRIWGKSSPDGSVDEIKGKRAVVKEDIAPNRRGKVEFHGTLWEAESEFSIKTGAIVEVVERNNLTLRVKPLTFK